MSTQRYFPNPDATKKRISWEEENPGRILGSMALTKQGLICVYVDLADCHQVYAGDSRERVVAKRTQWEADCPEFESTDEVWHVEEDGRATCTVAYRLRKKIYA